MNLDRRGIKGYIKYAQNCPLCGMTQPVVINGVVEGIGAERKTIPDRGYSFCNCKNIWFTNWDNIDLETYDENYFDCYNNDITSRAIRRYNSYFKYFENVNSFLEIGCINEALLDEAKKQGWKTTALDINPNVKHKHNAVIGNFEDDETYNKLEKTDVIFASHIFEHFKDPIKAIDKCYTLLNDNGYLFVAMPDPWFIDYNNPLQWDHWVIREHHILWDMDSFIDVLEEHGFKYIISKRNCLTYNICNRDFHIIVQKGGQNE